MDTEHDLFADDLDFNPLSADSDGDGLLDVVERPTSYTNWLVNDSDGDGVLDGNEDANFNGAFDPSQRETIAGDLDEDGFSDEGWDTDGDRLSDGQEIGLRDRQAPLIDLRAPPDPPLPAFEADSDPSTRTNPRSEDSDGDGLLDNEEDVNTNGAQDSGETDASRFDTDMDGLGDGVETDTGVYVDENDTGTYALNPDCDGDGLQDGAEVHTHHTLPIPAPVSRDSDGDGLSDFEETVPGVDGYVTIATHLDGDGDGTADGWDSDGDGLSDGQERGFTSDPNARDSDGDGLQDDRELARGADPWNVDSDDDGLLDGVETGTGTFVDEDDAGSRPTRADTDGDGFEDWHEVRFGGNPVDATIVPPAVEIASIEISTSGSWNDNGDGTMTAAGESLLSGDATARITALA